MAIVEPSGRISETDVKHRCFWMLLRAGLWNDRGWLDDFVSLDEKRWAEIIRISKRTGTACLIVDGTSMLGDKELPPGNLATALIKAALLNKKAHIRHNLAIKELFAFLGSQNVDAMLLKGQGVAAAYAKPESRGCGDIDIYIGAGKLDYALKKLEDKGFTKTEEINDTGKHASLFFDDLTVELHRHSIRIDNRSSDRAYQKWWQEEAEKSDNCVYISPAGNIAVAQPANAFKVRVPPPTINTFFLFYHIFHHYIGKEVQFRQFCDLARYLWANADAIDKKLLLEKIEEMHLLGVWQTFGSFLCRYLGLPREYFPGYKEVPDRKLAKFVGRLYDKCFLASKEQRARPRNRLMGKLHSFRQHVGAAIGAMSVFPKEGCEYILSTILSGTKLLFSDRNRSNTLENYKERRTHQKNADRQ